MRTVLLAVLLLLSVRVYALDAKTAYEQAVALEAKGKNASEILPLLEQAARNDSVEAQLMLGKIYQFGRRGVAKNPALAKKWYDMAAARGSQEAMTQLQMIYIKSGHEHFNTLRAEENAEWLAVQVRQGNAEAMVKLGILAETGKGVQQDFARAAELYETAAKMGMPQAQTRLGLLYEDGKGVPQSDEKAIEWLTKAAKTGYADAGRKLSELYAYSMAEPSKAYAWLVLSLSELFPNVQNLVEVSPDLERLLNTMTPQQVEDGQKLAMEYAEIIRSNKKKAKFQKSP